MLKSIYKELKNKVDKQIIIEKYTTLPRIKDVKEAYIGILSCKEYLKLISNEEGELLKGLFYDNVRDFQGDNPVNREVQETILNDEIKESFVLLNNGVTIVAKSIDKTGDTFIIRDFQIVNGCQTSHILHANKESLDDSINLSLKLIVTNDEEATNRIIKATNRQTEVKVEAFLSLQPFQKKLEEFYNSFNDSVGTYKLYYERRSRQYGSQDISSNNIVSITYQIKCFISMFLNEPHSTHRYYGELVKSYKDRMFVDRHSFIPYYFCCLVCHIFEHKIRYSEINKKYKKFRYHILMIIRLLLEKNENPTLSESQKTTKHYIGLLETIKDEKKLDDLIQKSLKIIDDALDSEINSHYSPNDAIRRKAFTQTIKDLSLNKKPKPIIKKNSK